MVTYTTKEMHAHTLAQTLAHPRTHARSHVRTSPRTHACSNTRTKMHTYTRMHARCAPVHFLHAYTLAPIQACAPECCHIRTHVGMHAPTTHARLCACALMHAATYARTCTRTTHACSLCACARSSRTQLTHTCLRAQARSPTHPRLNARA